MPFPMTCQQCKGAFLAAQRYSNPRRNKFCSRTCASVSGVAACKESFKLTATDRFWKLVDRSGGPGACWPFTGQLSEEGYGCTKHNGKRIPAHRRAYVLATGNEPGQLNVCHECDYRPCCNPTHLFLGTQRENVEDCIAKGRFPKGEQKTCSILTEAQVRAIRADNRTQMVLADIYGVRQSTISAIITRTNWRHVQ